MSEEIVEALEEGKIVRVSEAYARSEGLPIIRRTKVAASEQTPVKRTLEEERRLKQISKPHSNWRDRQVISELAENFNWQLIQARKKRGLTRRQVSKELSVDENSIRLVESGMLPSQDFILINKLQEFYKINLRKDGKDFNKPIKDMYSGSSSSVVAASGRSVGGGAPTTSASMSWREKLASKSKDRAVMKEQQRNANAANKNQPAQSQTQKDEIEILDDEI